MSTKEVLTLQLGNYSNYVGTHFWNMQYDSLRSDEDEEQEQNHMKLFRETSNHRQHNVVPRMITFDFKRNLRTLKLDGTYEVNTKLANGSNEPLSKVSKMNSTYDQSLLSEADTSLLSEADTECVTYKEKEIEKNDFLLNFHSKLRPEEKDFDIDDKVKSWSDFMSYTLSENSLQMLKNRFEDDETFAYHGLGCLEYDHLANDIEDKLHYWMEECNSIDGFMMFTDIHDGFSGLTSKLLEEIHDEYRNKTVIPFVNFKHTESVSTGSVIPWLNTALTFQSFKNYSSMFVAQGLHGNLLSKKSEELSIPNLSYKPELPYHSSAILASAIDSATLPWRQVGGCDMLELCQHITQDKFKLCANSVGFPLVKTSDGGNLFEQMIYAKELYGEFVTSLFPLGTTARNAPITQSVVFKNVCGTIVPAFEPKILRSLGLNYDIFQGKPKNFLEYFMDKRYPPNSTVSKLFYCNRKSSFKYPLSSMLNNCEGSAHNAMSSLFTSASFYDILHEVITKVESMNLNKLHLVAEHGFDRDTCKELVENLYGLAQEYELDDRFKEVYQ